MIGKKNWGFPWEHYRPLFELARDRGFEVRGLGHPDIQGLSARDRWMSTQISRLAEAAPEATIYGIVGEWHLASDHLPKMLRAKFNDEVAVLFQDVEKLYFQLAQKKTRG